MYILCITSKHTQSQFTDLTILLMNKYKAKSQCLKVIFKLSKQSRAEVWPHLTA